MKKFKVKPGDLLHVDENKTIGIVYRETPKKIWYYAFGENGLGGPFGVSKPGCQLYSLASVLIVWI